MLLSMLLVQFFKLCYQIVVLAALLKILPPSSYYLNNFLHHVTQRVRNKGEF